MRLLGVLGRRVSSGYPLDPAKVKLLLHFDGNYNDSSVNNVTTTAIGNASLSTTNPKFGSSCYLGLNTPNDGRVTTPAFFNFGNKRPFTICFWIRDGNGNGSALDIFPDSYGYSVLRVTIAGQINFGNALLGALGSQINLSQSLSSGSYKYVSIVGDGTNIKAYINGTQDGSTITHPNWPSIDSPVCIGNLKTGSSGHIGRIDEFLLYDGVLWTSNFTPPTLPFSV